MKAVYILVSLCLALAACGPSAEELTATAVVRQVQTQTAAPTKTPTPTATPQPTRTPTEAPTITSTPMRNVITKMDFENPQQFSSAVEADLFTLPRDNFGQVLEDLQGTKVISKCPEIWIGPVAGKPYPFYGLIVNAAPEHSEETFIYAIRPTIPEMEPYSFVGLVTVPPDVNENFFVTVEYRTPKGEPNPEELEISVVFPGCAIYKEIVSWP